MDLAESCTDDAQTPSDADVMHRMVRHNAEATLSMRFHYARCGGAPNGIWAFTHGVGLDAQLHVSDSRSITVRQLMHS